MTEITKLTEQQRKQNTFDKVWAHSAQMTEQCTRIDRPGCAYRSENGNRCFIGALLPDELYDKAMEGKEASFVVDDHANVKQYFDDASLSTNTYFLNQLQGIHDDGFPNREAELLECAKINELTIPA